MKFFVEYFYLKYEQLFVIYINYKIYDFGQYFIGIKKEDFSGILFFYAYKWQLLVNYIAYRRINFPLNHPF